MKLISCHPHKKEDEEINLNITLQCRYFQKHVQYFLSWIFRGNSGFFLLLTHRYLTHGTSWVRLRPCSLLVWAGLVSISLGLWKRNVCIRETFNLCSFKWNVFVWSVKLIY